jgi:hypothetical protein
VRVVRRGTLSHVLPLSDGIKARRFPIVTVAIIAVNFAVWLLYELPHSASTVFGLAYT